MRTVGKRVTHVGRNQVFHGNGKAGAAAASSYREGSSALSVAGAFFLALFVFGGLLSISGMLPSWSSLTGHQIGPLPVAGLPASAEPNVAPRDAGQARIVSIPPLLAASSPGLPSVVTPGS